MALADEQLDDILRAQYAGFEHLGIDLKLVNGDLAFGDDGDLLVHTNPVESFVALLQHRAQIAGNLAHDTRNPAATVNAAIAGISDDPRVRSAELVSTRWLDQASSPDVYQPDYQTLLVIVNIELFGGDVLENMTLPITFKGEVISG